LLRRGAAIALGLTCTLTLSLGLLVQLKLDGSQAASRAGRVDAAISAALEARTLEPWASSPYLQLSLIQEGLGNLAVAHAWIDGAIRRDRANWTLWIIKARLETKAGAIQAARASLARARALNPLGVPRPTS
jgi:tetratricopeptide (TPR) repeat protein